MNKQLYRSGDFVVGVLDDKNYYTAKITKRKEGNHIGEEVEADQHFFADIANAIKWIADRVAKQDSTDLKTWLESYRSEVAKVEAALK